MYNKMSCALHCERNIRYGKNRMSFKQTVLLACDKRGGLQDDEVRRRVQGAVLDRTS